jgi:hypothetical protein
MAKPVRLGTLANGTRVQQGSLKNGKGLGIVLVYLVLPVILPGWD